MINFSHFSIYFIVLVLNDIDFASYADGNALYKACGNVDVVAKTLRIPAEKLSKWFKD